MKRKELLSSVVGLGGGGLFYTNSGDELEGAT